jgi:hypothetical protein
MIFLGSHEIFFLTNLTNFDEFQNQSKLLFLFKNLMISQWTRLQFFNEGGIFLFKSKMLVKLIDIKRQKIDCLRFVMCPLLAPGFQGFFFDAVVNSTNEANKAGRTHN